MKCSIAMVAAALSLASAAGAQAQSVKVSLVGLNVNTAAGARVALTRIRNAARELCGDDWSYREIEAGASWDACFNGAVDRAVAKVNRPMLTSLRESAHPQPAMLSLGGH